MMLHALGSTEVEVVGVGGVGWVEEERLGSETSVLPDVTNGF